ncbi:MAG: PKD domain-containing protein [Anaerolineae bacterium]|nr:PKD domain-containing protein [Anaerolineae bacterium]
MNSRKVAIGILILVPLAVLSGLWLAGATTATTAEAQASALVPKITVRPASTVRVGQEVLFDALGTTYTDTQMLLKGRYEWDFGDDYVAKFGDPYYYSGDSGVAISHFYMRPGVYTVTLTVSVWSQFDGGDYPIGNPTAVASTTTRITVTGQSPKLPPWPDTSTRLDMRLDGNLADSSSSGLVGQWQGGAGGFVPGIANQAADLTSGAYISVTDPGVFSGLSQIAVSFWAKKALTSTYGTLLDKPGQFNVSIGSQRVLDVRLTTSQGTARATSYLAYDVDNTHWHHYAFTYDGTTLRAFIDGKELATKPYSGTVANSTSSLLIGRSASNPQVFNGYVDEVRIYSRTLSLDDLFTGFDLWHAPFHARIAQYIHAKIPSAAYSNPSNRLRVSVTGNNGYTATVFEKTNLTAEEVFLFRNASLPAGSYTLTAQLLGSGGSVLDQVTEYFDKPYNGAPRVGIDENNAFRVNGQPFFPVTPWLLDKDDMASWKQNGYINALYAEGYYDPPHTIATWTDYLTHAAGNGLYTIGPARWFDLGLPSHWSPRGAGTLRATPTSTC